MQVEQHLRFGPYRLDLRTGQLWRGTLEVKLTPKALAVLRVLGTRAGQVVTKGEFFGSVWPETVVSDDALAACIQELRRALRDDARKPRFIETVHRRGYRFIGKVVGDQQGGATQEAKVEHPFPAPNPQPPTPTLVGREPDLAFLHERLERAVRGERQLVFITGEPGIGKTALVEKFLFGVRSEETFGVQKANSRTPNSELSSTPVPWFAWGQCIEQFGEGEAYLPILSALSQLCREPGHERLLTVLQQYAPTWLMQMPALVKQEEFDDLRRKTAGATRACMLRELAEALEVITAERPLVMVLEDLHWSDPSTLELLAFLARRRQPARLMVIGTYRPVEMLADGHPLKRTLQELFAHHLSPELVLRLLTEADVSAYLHQRFPASVLPTQLSHVLYQRTGGNPLFLTSLVRDLVSRDVLIQFDGQWVLQGEVEQIGTETPESIRHLIARQRERLLPDEQRALEAASLAGTEFSAALVAAAIGTPTVAIEEQCHRFTERQQFLRPVGISPWPDGTLAERYGFRHALYQQLWHERVSLTRRQQWHLRMGERLEVAYARSPHEVAADLARHFEQGRDYAKAIRYLQLAGEQAVRRNANQEAASYFTKGLELLKGLPATPERTHKELMLQTTLGSALVVTKGLGSHESRTAYDRARDLCQQIEEAPQLFPVLYGLSAYYVQQEEMVTARELAEQCLTWAKRRRDSALMVATHRLLVSAWHWSGNPILAHEHCERGMALYDSQQWRSLAHVYGMDSGVSCLSLGAWALWHLGYPDQALKRSQAALALAREGNHLYTLAWALNAASWTHWYRREGQAACMLADEAVALSITQEFPHWIALGRWMRGQALIELGQWEEGTTQLQHGLEAYRATGAVLSTQESGLSELARGYGHRGQVEEGLRMITEALAGLNQVRHYEAETCRIKGELTLQQFKVQSSKLPTPS